MTHRHRRGRGRFRRRPRPRQGQLLMEPLNASMTELSLTEPNFTTEQLLELEKLFSEMAENALDHNLCHEIATNFSAAGNQTSISGEQVYNWFQTKLDESQHQVASPGALVLYYDTPAGSSATQEGKRRVDVSESAFTYEARSKKDLAWHDVANMTGFRYSRTGELEVRVQFLNFDRVEDEWVTPKNQVRARSIPLEPSECHMVKEGDLVLCFLERDDYALYFDARVVRVQRRLHNATDCKCIFTVRFLHDNSEEEIHWKGLCYRPTQEKSTQEESVACHNTPEPTQEELTKEESAIGHNSPEPTKVLTESDIKDLWG